MQAIVSVLLTKYFRYISKNAHEFVKNFTCSFIYRVGKTDCLFPEPWALSWNIWRFTGSRTKMRPIIFPPSHGGNFAKLFLNYYVHSSNALFRHECSTLNYFSTWNTLNVIKLESPTEYFQFALKQRIDLKEEPFGDKEKMMVDWR